MTPVPAPPKPKSLIDRLNELVAEGLGHEDIWLKLSKEDYEIARAHIRRYVIGGKK